MSVVFGIVLFLIMVVAILFIGTGKDDEKVVKTKYLTKGDKMFLRDRENLETHREIKPCHFTGGEGWYGRIGSIFHKGEFERAAFDLMKILEKNGNEWRELSMEEIVDYYDCDNIDEKLYKRIIPYTVSPEKASEFSPGWNKLYKRLVIWYDNSWITKDGN